MNFNYHFTKIHLHQMRNSILIPVYSKNRILTYKLESCVIPEHHIDNSKTNTRGSFQVSLFIQCTCVHIFLCEIYKINRFFVFVRPLKMFYIELVGTINYLMDTYELFNFFVDPTWHIKNCLYSARLAWSI